MATVRAADAPTISALHQQIVSALTQIDRALDRGDRRAFRIWSGHYRDTTTRLTNLLIKIATH